MSSSEEGYDTVDATGWTGEPSSPQRRPQQQRYSYVKPKSSRIVNYDVSSGPVKYKMNHRQRGTALIISNRNFNTKTLRDRPGTETDVEMMKNTLISLGFDVDVVVNVTTDELQACLMCKASDDHSNRDCFLCVIMTHGSEDHVLGTDGREIHLKTLISYFGGQRCPSLSGKPKIFILNACQGDKLDEGHDVADAECAKVGDADDNDDMEDVHFQNLPYELDFLYIHSTMHGYYSYRHTKQGSFFIQTLCNVLEQYGEQLEICKILTIVSRRMAIEFESKAKISEYHGKKQCPCYLSLLTKQLYFTQDSPKKVT